LYRNDGGKHGSYDAFDLSIKALVEKDPAKLAAMFDRIEAETGSKVIIESPTKMTGDLAKFYREDISAKTSARLGKDFALHAHVDTSGSHVFNMDAVAAAAQGEKSFEDNVDLDPRHIPGAKEVMVNDKGQVVVGHPASKGVGVAAAAGRQAAAAKTAVASGTTPGGQATAAAAEAGHTTAVHDSQLFTIVTKIFDAIAGKHKGAPSPPARGESAYLAGSAFEQEVGKTFHQYGIG
jgi:hypothetical protein